MPAWAAISAGGMETIVLPSPVRHVYIAADNDLNGRGQQAARALARRLLDQGRHIKILLPDRPNTDWADLLETR